NFYEFGNDVLYEINIDNDNDAIADITYQFRFKTVLTDTGPSDIFLYNTGQITSISDTTWNRKQFYSVTRKDSDGSHTLGTDLPCPPCNVGKNSIPSYAPLTAQAIQPLGTGGQVFAGQRADGFYVDLGSVFDLADLRPFQTVFFLNGPAMPGINTLAGLNVHSIAIQVPITELTKDGAQPTNYEAEDSTIGIWTTASRQRGSIGGYGGFAAGPWAQLSRLGMPLINEVIIPMGQKDYWNSQEPRHDAQFGSFYDHPSLAALLNVLYPNVFPNIAAYTATSSNTRPDLDAVLLTGVRAGLWPGFQNFTGATKADLLRLNVAIPPVTSASSVNILGVVGGDNAGFPNGRRVVDDVVSVELKAVAGALLGDAVPSFTPDASAGALFDVGGPSTEPTTVADLSSAGLDFAYPGSFPYLSDPWDGYDNPSLQNIPVRGNP
ncbi:MAG TPA: DUF4331 domain-containing protein, partial [Acidimicrobiales bacterium]|nr:DUF4331 domain-containing protein [Acidimicrobiales bacterium]